MASALSIAAKNDFTLQGSGRDATILQVSASPGQAILLNSGASTNNRITIRDLTIYVSFTGASWSAIIQGDGQGYDYLFENIHFKGDGWTTSVAYFINLSPNVNGNLRRISVRNSYFENTSTSQILNGLLFRGTWDVIVTENQWRNMNNPIAPDNIFAKRGLIYSNNLEVIDTSGIDAEGPDITSWSNVVYSGNLQRASVSLAEPRSTGGLLLDTGGGLPSNNWTITGNYFYRNPVQVTPRSGAGNTVANILISDNVVHGMRTSFSQIHLYDDPNSASQNVTVSGNLLTGFGVSGIRIPTGYTRLVVRYNQGFSTEAWGSATIAASTTVTVTHTLAGTPTEVLLTPRSTGYGTIAVTARGATTFTITVTTSGTYTIDWQAIYRP